MVPLFKLRFGLAMNFGRVDRATSLTISYPTPIPTSELKPSLAMSPFRSPTRHPNSVVSRTLHSSLDSSPSSPPSQVSSSSCSHATPSSSSEASSSSSLGSPVSKINRQKRRKAAYFEKITLTRAGEAEERYVYAHSHVSTTSRDSGDDQLASQCSSLSISSSSKLVERRISIERYETLERVAIRKVVVGQMEMPDEDELTDESEDEEDFEDEQALGIVYSRPGSSQSTRSDPFEFSSYLSKPNNAPPCSVKAAEEKD